MAVGSIGASHQIIRQVVRAAFSTPRVSIEKCKEEADKKLLELGYELLTEDDMEKIELLR